MKGLLPFPGAISCTLRGENADSVWELLLARSSADSCWNAMVRNSAYEKEFLYRTDAYRLIYSVSRLSASLEMDFAYGILKPLRLSLHVTRK